MAYLEANWTKDRAWRSHLENRLHRIGCKRTLIHATECPRSLTGVKWREGSIGIKLERLGQRNLDSNVLDSHFSKQIHNTRKTTRATSKPRQTPRPNDLKKTEREKPQNAANYRQRPRARDETHPWEPPEVFDLGGDLDSLRVAPVGAGLVQEDDALHSCVCAGVCARFVSGISAFEEVTRVCSSCL